LHCEGNLRCKGGAKYKKRVFAFSKHTITYSFSGIKIGCKTKTRKEWVDWFLGDEEYETPRDSNEFKQIETAFRMAVIAQDNDVYLDRS